MHVETSGNMHDATSYAAIGQTAGATSLGIGAGQNFVLQARPTPELSIVGQWWRIVKRRKWIIVSSIVAGILFGLLVNLMSQRLYTAISTVEIARDSARVLNEDVVSREITTADQEFYQTQYGLLKSRSLAERVVQSMRLSRDPAFRRAFGLDARGLSASPSAAIPGARRTAAGAELEYIRGILLSHIKINPERNSRLVLISFSSPDPALSARIADAWALGFIDWNIARGFEESQFTRDHLESELVKVRGQLEESERAAVGYAARQGIFEIETTNAAGQRVPSPSLTEQSLQAFNEELSRASADRVTAEAAYRNTAHPVSSESAALGTLRQKRAEVAAEYRQLLVQFEPQYPAARALSEQIAQLDRSITQEERRGTGNVGRDLKALYQAAADRENAIRTRVNEATQRLTSERQTGIQYHIFQREVDNNRQLYNALLERFKQVGVAASANRTNVSIVDRADLPEAPSSPVLPLNLLLGAFMGVVAGLLFTIIREQIDVAVNEPSDIERQVGLPLLGTVPYFGQEEDQLTDLLVDRKSALSDAMLSLRTRIAFTTTHGFPKTLGVTSSRPAEGKSTTAIAIANTLAQSGKRVLLIDCDMRSPSLAAMLGESNAAGLSNVLSGDNDFTPLIARPDKFAFDLMAAGPNPPNAAELLASDRLREMFDALADRYDHFICDSPPVIGLADALLIATDVEATLYIVRAHATRVNEVRTALLRLSGVPSHIIGAALTHFDAGQSSYGYDYDYNYGNKRTPDVQAKA